MYIVVGRVWAESFSTDVHRSVLTTREYPLMWLALQIVIRC